MKKIYFYAQFTKDGARFLIPNAKTFEDAMAYVESKYNVEDYAYFSVIRTVEASWEEHKEDGVTYYVCSHCGCCFSDDDYECPRCHSKMHSNFLRNC